MKKILLIISLTLLSFTGFTQKNVAIDAILLINATKDEPIMLISEMNMIDVAKLNLPNETNLALYITKTSMLGSIIVEIANTKGNVYEARLCCPPFILNLNKKLFDEDQSYFIRFTPVSGPCVGIQGQIKIILFKLINYR